ncbi:MAG: deacylase [Chitinivibrionales bacterium]|nr:deacylase [Chitinivibrionales bacterium]
MVGRLKELLDRQGVRYRTVSHSQAFTAQQIAASAHISGWRLAKVVMVKVDGRMVMTVLPAAELVDVRRVAEIMGGERAELAHEDEYVGLFDDCEPGAEPPFGNLYGLPVLSAASLGDYPEICFNAGTHRELVQMGYQDYEKLVQPTVASFDVREHYVRV